MSIDENIKVRMEQWKDSVNIESVDFDKPSGWKPKFVPPLTYNEWKKDQKVVWDTTSKQKTAEEKRQERLKNAIGAETPIDEELLKDASMWQAKADRITASKKKLLERIEPYVEEFFNSFVCLDVGAVALTEGKMPIVGKTPRKKKVIQLVNYEALGVPKLDFDKPDKDEQLEKLDDEALVQSLTEVMNNKDAIYNALHEVEEVVGLIQAKIKSRE